MTEVNDLKAVVFDHICKCIAWNDYVSNISSVAVSKHLGITLYKVRKVIKSLVEEGLLVSDIQVLYSPPWYDDDWYPPRIYRGYTLTKLGFETECYKKHYAEMCESYSNWASEEY